MESVFLSPLIQRRIVASNERAFAFPTNIPIVPGHLLICPKRVMQTVYELTPEELSDVLRLMESLQKALKAVFGATSFNYAWNEGEDAGQSIQHLHVHMLPRKKGDTGITEYEPRKFLYRPGSREASKEDELQAVAQLIKAAL